MIVPFLWEKLGVFDAARNEAMEQAINDVRYLRVQGLLRPRLCECTPTLLDRACRQHCPPDDDA